MVIKSFTDARATFNYNLVLSENRANATFRYLVNKGVAADKMSAKGYGETNLVNNCTDNVKCNESSHQQNRRSEVQFVK